MKRPYILLLWLIPAYLIFLTLHQYSIYSINSDIVEKGTAIEATVTDFRIKHIASQTNGYIVLGFTIPDTEEIIRKKLSLSVQIAAQLIGKNLIPIRYLPNRGEEVIMMPTYELQQEVVLINMLITISSALVLGFVSFVVSKKFVFGNEAPRGNEEFEVVK